MPERGIGGFGALQIRNTILELRLLINIDFVEFLPFFFLFFFVLDCVLTVKDKVTSDEAVAVEKTV